MRWFGVSEYRAGRSKMKAVACTPSKMYICQSWITPVQLNMAKQSATDAITLWVRKTIFRRLIESANKPANRLNRIVGISRINPIAPRANGLSVKFRICQGIAQINTWFPIQEKTVPVQKIV
jgi:hypothetical protein